jgi:hypothetical protein
MKKFLFVLYVLLSASLACNQQISTGGPTPEYPPIAVSTQAAQSLNSKLSSLGVATGDVTLTITEAELTSAMAQQENPTLQNPQIYFRDGKMKLYVNLVTTNLTAGALIVINPTVTNGQLSLVVEKADMGPLPMPDDVLKNLSTTINEQILGMLSKLPKGFKVKTVTAKDGLLTISANITK